MIKDERIDEIVNSGGVTAHIPELLEGIQDMNWPTAERIAVLLRSMPREV
ncbi:DUF5071 domain-containing protein [Cohnella sp.]